MAKNEFSDKWYRVSSIEGCFDRKLKPKGRSIETKVAAIEE